MTPYPSSALVTRRSGAQSADVRVTVAARTVDRRGDAVALIEGSLHHRPAPCRPLVSPRSASVHFDIATGDFFGHGAPGAAIPVARAFRHGAAVMSHVEQHPAHHRDMPNAGQCREGDGPREPPVASTHPGDQAWSHSGSPSISTRVTELVYRKELRLVLTRGAVAMDALFPRD